MADITIVTLLISIVIVITLIINKFRKLYSYWNERGIVGPKPLPILGNYAPVIFGIKSEADLLRKVYEKFPKEKYIGIYKGIHPALVIRDRNIIKQILVKDFDSFNVRSIENTLGVYDKSLYIIDGDDTWKMLRKTFSPGLATSRISMMLPNINDSLKEYVRYIDTLTVNNTYFEMRNLNNKYVLDTFSKLIFGKDMRVYRDDNAFEKTVLQTINTKLHLSLLQVIDLTCPILLKHVSHILIRKFDSLYQIFYEFIATLLQNQSRMKENGIKGDNFVNFLLVLKEKQLFNDVRTPFVINDDFIVQQTMTFFLAAFESISNTLTLLMYELSRNQDIQEKCIREVDTIVSKHTGEVLTTEVLTEMKYLQSVIDETLRMHPVSNAIDRKCIKNYLLRDENIMIDKGVSVLIPIHGLHYDSTHFPNPECFKPERFITENKDNIMEYSYLPFGEGPRMCIGSRLAKAVLLIGTFGFLSKFQVQPTNNTFEIKHDPKRIRAMATSKNIWLKVKRRQI